VRNGIIPYTYTRGGQRSRAHQNVLRDLPFADFIPFVMPEVIIELWIEMTQFQFDIFAPGPIAALRRESCPDLM
jgi:hypothetical protein